MRHSHYLVLTSGLIALGSDGCGTFTEECTNGQACSGVFGTGGASSTITTTTTTGTSTSTSVVAGCNGMPDDILAPITTGNYVNEDCGVFVQADALDESGVGTKDRPFKTVKAAIAGAKGKAIFLCTTSTFVEKLDISAPLSLYGGFDCAKDWSWSSEARSVVMGNPDEIPVTIEKSAVGVTIWNVAVKAADASKDSGSSIGMAIDDVPVTLTRCDVSAGVGKAGLAGMSQSQTSSATAGASATTNAAAGCIPAFAALPGKTMCGNANTDGGVGGLGGDSTKDGGKGQSGGGGTPMPTGMPGKGGDGDGQPGANVCSNGVAGKPGDAGSHGTAGTTTDTMLSLSGVSGGSGGAGKEGIYGQGGGGGGGTRVGNYCGPSEDMPTFGPGGGGGGAGGCGGLGGGGGQEGGSSIAILSLGIQLTLTDVALTTSAGGSGGAGGLAQMGGAGGKGAIGGLKVKVGFNNGCDGATGGKGGDGGKGGGGRGGHSIGLAFAAAPGASLATKFIGGPAGTGGDGGNKGMPGEAVACWDFSANKACF